MEQRKTDLCKLNYAADRGYARVCVERYPLFNIHEHHGQVVSSILLKNRRSLAERSVAGKDADTEPHLGWDIGRV